MDSPEGMGSPITYVPKFYSTTDLDAKASVANAKKGLAIIDERRSYDFTIGQLMGEEYRKSGLRDNRSDPTRPQLFRPERATTQIDINLDESWEENYQEMLKQLPGEIQAWFAEQGALAPNDRAPLSFVLHNTLSVLATSTAWVDKAAGPLPEESDIYARAELNLLLPFIALQGATAQNREILNSVENQLRSLGPNHPQYDLALGYANDLKELTDEMDIIASDLQEGGSDEE